MSFGTGARTQPDPLTEKLKAEILYLKEQLASAHFEIERLTKYDTISRDFALQGHWEYNLLTKVFIISPVAAKMLGYKSDELTEQKINWLERIHPEDAGRLKQVYRNYLQGRTDKFRCRHRVLCNDGTYKSIDTAGKFTGYDAEGKPSIMTGTHTDISGYLAAADETAEENKFLYSIFKKNQMSMLLIDPETGSIVDANEGAERFYGYTINQLKNKKIGEINQYDKLRINNEMHKALDDRQNYFVFPHKLANGEIRTVEVHSTPITRKGKKLLCSVIQDVTLGNRQMKQLSQSELMYRSFAECTTDGFLMTDKDARIIIWNKALEEITGYTQEEVIGKNALKVQLMLTVPEARRDELLRALEMKYKIFLSSQSDSFSANSLENILITKDGETKFIQHSRFIVQMPEGNGIGSVLRDITNNKIAEHRLKDSEELFRTLFEKAPLGVVRIDTSARLMLANTSLTQMLGYTQSELINFSMFGLVIPEDITLLNLQLQNLFQHSNETFQFETRLKRADGNYHWVSLSLSVLKNASALPYYILFIKDIASRKLAELSLRENEQKLQKVYDIVPMAIAFTDKNGNIIEGNALAEQILGVSKTHRIAYGYSKTDWKLVDGNLRELNIDEFPSSIARRENRTVVMDNLGLKKGDEVLWIKSTAMPIAGDKYSVIIAFYDITKEKNTEKKLIQLNNEIEMSSAALKEAGQSKDKFISILAHDLRAPFMSFLGLSEVLASEDIKSFQLSEISEMARNMNKSAQNTMQLMNDILDWGRLFTNAVNFHPEDVSCSEIITHTIDLLESSFKVKSITPVVSIIREVTIRIDRNHLSNVLRNVISNAIKFSYKDSVVKVSVDAKEKWMVISVKDTGIGMSPEQQAGIFTPGNKSLPGTEKEKGSGLGLLICNEFIQKIGGEIQVSSEPGKGSEFKIMLPV